MYLLVEFDNGTDSRIEVNPSSTLKIVDGSNNTVEAFAFNDVKDVTFNLGTPTVPDVPAAEPVEVAGVPTGPWATEELAVAAETTVDVEKAVVESKPAQHRAKKSA